MGLVHLFVKDVEDKTEIEKVKKIAKDLVIDLKPSDLDDKGEMKADALATLPKLLAYLAPLNSATQVLTKLKDRLQLVKTVKAAGDHKFKLEIETDYFESKLKVVAPEIVGEEDTPGLSDGDRPAKVTFTGNTSCPKGCPETDHATLVKALKKPESYWYDGKKRLWTVDVGNQTGHRQGKGWKCYVDAADGSGTKWRMEISWKYDENSKTLAVKADVCGKGH